MNTPVFAWCFDHGVLHRFRPRDHASWCTGRWVHLDAYVEATALGMKQEGWGDARFLHDLNPDQQATIAKSAEMRNQLDSQACVHLPVEPADS